MGKALSKTQIDRLGDRLKKGPLTEEDLRLLDDYRLSFGEAYEAVVQTVRQCGESPTGRIKTRNSIVEKLRRESIRLTQVQDIVGCRIVVADILEQERAVESLKASFAKASVVDRRENPSYGYRAVHVVAVASTKPVEIQVRTRLQHLWAELSEKASEVIDQTIKYGGGPELWRTALDKSSRFVARCEKLRLKAREESGTADTELVDSDRAKIAELLLGIEKRLKKVEAELPDTFLHMLSWLDEGRPTEKKQ